MNPTTSGQIYLIRADQTDSVKIGFSVDHVKRIASIQTGCPHPLILVKWWLGSLQDERRLHSIFADRRLVGEWFRVPPSDLESVIARIDKEVDGKGETFDDVPLLSAPVTLGNIASIKQIVASTHFASETQRKTRKALLQCCHAVLSRGWVSILDRLTIEGLINQLGKDMRR